MKKKPSGNKTNRSNVLWWGLEWLAGLAAELVPLCLSGEQGLIIYWICLYVLHPLMSAYFAFELTYRRGVNEYLTFFPIGLILILSPVYIGAAGIGCACLLIGLVFASIGRELKIRKGKS